MSMITCPEFTNLDLEIIGDFNCCLTENIEEIEFCIYKLDSSDDTDLIHELFRAMHSFKGNCRMVLLLPFVFITHELEEVVAEMREGKRHYHHFYGSVIIAVVSLINDLIKQLEVDGECSKQVVDLLEVQIKRIRETHSNPTNDDLVVTEEVLTELVKLQEGIQNSGKINQQEEEVSESIKVVENLNNQGKAKPDAVKIQKNLAFFDELANQQDNLSIYRRGRTKEVLQLCLAINKELKTPVDEEQLIAAVYIHDFGMAFVPATILNKQESLSREELTMIRKHVITGTQLLLNMGGWQEAAIMVAQHHERYDGGGYPRGLKQDDIHPGAVLISLADTYCAITNERSDRSYKRSLFSAVTLINSESSKQFSPVHVEKFNETIRKLYINPS